MYGARYPAAGIASVGRHLADSIRMSLHPTVEHQFGQKPNYRRLHLAVPKVRWVNLGAGTENSSDQTDGSNESGGTGCRSNRSTCSILRQIPSNFIGLGGHDCHLLEWINQVDRRPRRTRQKQSQNRSRKEKTKAQSRVSVTASMAWPGFHSIEQNHRAPNRWQHRL